MQNGTNFLTGNHPVEMFVPMLHFIKAGFEMDIATPTGKPLKLEEWAFPEKDREVMIIYKTFKSQILAPLSLQEIVTKLDKNSPYTAVYIPGGHKMLPLTGYIPGAMPWYLGERLQVLGVTIVNKMPNGKVCHDRKLITGDSPKAANKLGKLAATLMLSETV